MPISQLCLSDNNKFLAFCSDSGTVGVIDLGTSSVSRMRHKHESVDHYSYLSGCYYLITDTLFRFAVLRNSYLTDRARS